MSFLGGTVGMPWKGKSIVAISSKTSACFCFRVFFFSVESGGFSLSLSLYVTLEESHFQTRNRKNAVSFRNSGDEKKGGGNLTTKNTRVNIH